MAQSPIPSYKRMPTATAIMADMADTLSQDMESMPLPVDVFSLLLLRIVQVADAKREGSKLPYLRLACAVVLYAVYVVLAFGVCLFLVVEINDKEGAWGNEVFYTNHGMSVHEAGTLVQRVGTKDVTEEEHNALFNPGGLLAKCEVQGHVHPVAIYHLMVFLWVSRMWQEFKSARDWCMNLWLCDKKGNHEWLTSDDGLLILRLSRKVQAAIFILVPLVKFFIFIPVLSVGCRFLMLQTQGFALVLKVVAMQVILGIDEQLVESFALRRACAQLKSMKWKLHKGSRYTDKILWYDGVGGMVMLMIAGLLVVYYTEFRFQDLMHFRRSCYAYTCSVKGQCAPPLSKIFLQVLEL